MQGQSNLSGLLERIAVGVEKLGEPPPPFEMELQPAMCPKCHMVNPRVRVGEQGGTGHVSEIYVEMICECGATIYGVPMQWSMHDSTTSLRAELVERNESAGNGRISRNNV